MIIGDPILETHPIGHNGQFLFYGLNEAPGLGSHLSCVKTSA